MRNHTITPSGLLFLGITGFVFVAAINSGTNLLFLALGLMIGAFIVSALLSRISLRNVSVRRIMNGAIVAGEEADIQYEVTNRKRGWPCFALHVSETAIGDAEPLVKLQAGYALHIPPTRSVIVPARLLAMRRGMIRLNDIRVACSFPFGFVSHYIKVPQPEELVVYPRIGTLNRRLALRCRDTAESGAMTSSMRRGNDEFYGLREYRAGDNVRSIHWRSTARTGRLTIREMANNAPPQMIIVLNLRDWRTVPGAEDKIERAIEVAASLVCHAFLENFAVGVAIAGTETGAPPMPHTGREARSALLHRLATLDVNLLRTNLPLPMPNRLGTRAEWIILSLTAGSVTNDLFPPAAPNTQLCLDAPDSDEWVHFVTAGETMRILRESQCAVPVSSDVNVGKN